MCIRAGLELENSHHHPSSMLPFGEAHLYPRRPLCVIPQRLNAPVADRIKSVTFLGGMPHDRYFPAFEYTWRALQSLAQIHRWPRASNTIRRVGNLSFDTARAIPAN